MRSCTFVLVASVVVPLSVLSAQQPPPVEVGQRVQVSVPRISAVRLVGPVLTVEPSDFTMIVESGPRTVRGDTVQIPFNWITKFTVLAVQPPPVPSLLVPGARVRVSAPHCGISEQAGLFQGLLGDTLVLVYGTSNIRCLRSQVTRLEMSVGHETVRTQAGLFGLVVGLLGGVVVGGSAGERYSEGRPFMAVVGGVAGAAMGWGVGSMLGSSSKRDRWEEVPLDRLTVSFAPQRDGRFALGASLRF